MIQLYDLPPSGNSYRVRLMLALLGLPYKRTTVRHDGGHFDSADVAKLNPLGEVPILVDGRTVLRDSQAILVYLALKHGPEWLPVEPAAAGAIAQWLSFSANEIQNGPRYARAIRSGMVAGDVAKHQRAAERALGALERHLTAREWLELGRPTIADVACYPYVANAAEGGLDMGKFVAVTAWLTRIERLPRFVAFDSAYPQAA
jgi:glutathione S-transferase